MILNSSIFTATIEAAKLVAANRPEVIRAIDRAVIEITKAAYWSFDGETLTIQSTTSKKLYRVDAAHTCEARSKVCKHHIARLLMVRYSERLAAADAPDERAALVADVKAAWHRARPFAAISEAVRSVYGVTKLDALPVESLKQIHIALTR